MKRNKAGEVVTDKFRFPRQAVRSLAEWLDSADSERLRGQSRVIFEVRPYGVDVIREALRQEAERL